MLLLSNADVQQLLDMPTCLEALEAGYYDLLDGNAAYGHKSTVWVPSDDNPEGFFSFGSMQGANRRLGTYALRMKLDIKYWPDGKTEEKYCREPGSFCGLILLVSTRNAEPLAMIQDGYLQHMRVGGCAGLGVKYLARADASSVGMLGSGGMARSFLRAFCAVRDIKSVKVYSPTPEHRRAYAEEMSEALDIEVTAVDTPEEAAKGADIFSACTDAMHNQVMSADWLEPGMHLTGSGGRMDPRVYQREDVTIVKLGSGAEDAASTIIGSPEEVAKNLHYTKGQDSAWHRRRFPHLVEVLAGKVAGRTSERDITYFIDEGTQGLQFATVAGTVHRLAQQAGLGRELPTDWFLQDIRD